MQFFITSSFKFKMKRAKFIFKAGKLFYSIFISKKLAKLLKEYKKMNGNKALKTDRMKFHINLRMFINGLKNYGV